MKLNNKGFTISGIIYALVFLFVILVFAILGLLGSRKVVLDKYKQDVINDIEGNNNIINIGKIDRSGASAPVLASSMIPIIYNGENIVKAEYISEYDQNWYNYEDKKWANSVIIKEEYKEQYNDITAGTVINKDHVLAYYVWIPRYKYKLFNADYDNLVSTPQLIDIAFENTEVVKSINNSNGEYLTHPAFTFDNTEVSGFWIGKFETTGSIGSISVLPNSIPITNYSVKEMYEATKNAASSFGITSSDLHMLKNSEWAAVAYLSHSMYGQGNVEIAKNSYNNNGKKTGCGSGSTNTTITCEASFGSSLNYYQSTTGNIYGVFDMSGGADEYLMSVMLYTDNNVLYSESGFDSMTMPNSKYYDTYMYGEDSSNVNTYRRGPLGSATKENWGWYQDEALLVDLTGTWQCRGGNSTDTTNAGIFAFKKSDGSASQDISFRTAIIE